MNTYYITATKKSRGNILELHAQGGMVFPASNVIDDIENGVAKYKTVVTTDIVVRETPQGGKYLTTSADGIAENNLDNLPDPESV